MPWDEAGEEYQLCYQDLIDLMLLKGERTVSNVDTSRQFHFMQKWSHQGEVNLRSTASAGLNGKRRKKDCPRGKHDRRSLLVRLGCYEYEKNVLQEVIQVNSNSLIQQLKLGRDPSPFSIKRRVPLGIFTITMFCYFDGMPKSRKMKNSHICPVFA